LQRDAQDVADFGVANKTAAELAKEEATRVMGPLPKEAEGLLETVKQEPMMKLLYENMMHKGNFRDAGPEGMLKFHLDMEMYARRIAVGDAAQKIVQNANVKASRAARLAAMRQLKAVHGSVPAQASANATIVSSAADKDSSGHSKYWQDVVKAK
jgi:hypothetical protein